MIDEKTSEIPPGLKVPDCPFWKRAMMYVLGALMQPVRNLV